MNKPVRYLCATTLNILLFATPVLADQKEQCLQFYYLTSYTKALPYCIVSAEKGDSQSQYVLGLMYSDGLGVKKNKPKALKWLQAAAEQHYAAAHYKLNQLNNELASPDEMMRQFINKQKRSETPAATRRSGQVATIRAMDRLNQSKPGSTAPAATHHDILPPEKSQSTLDSPITQTANTNTAHKNTDVSPAAIMPTPDDKTRYQQYLAAAQKGHAHARFMLGLFYLEGRGVQKNSAQAGKWIKKAARQGLAEAQLTMGLLYDQGYADTAPSTEKATFWFIRAAKQGSAEAQYSLGLIYANGTNGQKNMPEALKWWRKAAVHGYAKAQHNLAVLYLNGTGVEVNRDKAMVWFIKEAEQGEPQTQFNLGRLYSEGKWFNQSGGDATNWFYHAGETWVSMNQADKARQSADKIRQLASKQHLTSPNLFLADVLIKQIEENSKQ